MKKSSFLHNWLFKAISITVVSFVIGLIDNASDWLDADGNFNNIIKNGKILVILLTIIYIIYVIYLAYNEKNKIKTIIQLKH